MNHNNHEQLLTDYNATGVEKWNLTSIAIVTTMQKLKLNSESRKEQKFFEVFEMESNSISYFHIFITGQIESATFPLGADGSQVFCRYEIVSGSDWEFLSGNKAGITQSCICARNDTELIFNMPIEACYKATNPFGCNYIGPQVVLSVYGKNIWGIETALGYARIHIPTFGNEMKSSSVPILIPKCTTTMAALTSWITGRNPELKNPKILTEGIKTKGLQMESYGQLNLSLRTISRGSTKMGFE